MTNEELVQAIRDGNSELMPQLWEAVEKFIWMMASRRLGNDPYRQQQREDLYIAGYEAMLNAVEGFKSDRDASFIHYLTYHLHSVFNDVLGQRTTRQKKDPLNNNCVSLDKEMGEAGEKKFTLADTIPDPAAEEAFEEVAERSHTEAVKVFIHNGINTLPNNYKMFYNEYLKCNLSRAEAIRRLNMSRSAGEKAYYTGERLLRHYAQQHEAELNELDCIRGRATRATGWQAWENRRRTSTTEYLALELVELEERHQEYLKLLGRA